MQQIKVGKLPSQMKSKAVDKLQGITILDGRIVLQERIYLKPQKGAVYKAYDKTLENNVAVKVYQRDQLDQHDYRMYKYEVQVMKEVKSPHIVKFIEECDTPNTSKIYLVMEYCQGVTLHDYYNDDEYQKPELEALTYLIQILQGLYALHVKNFVHRDLKLENIMVFKGKIKIIDYGFSLKMFEKNGKPLTKSQLGTEVYEAPEILLGQEYNPFKSDIYSLGVMLYLMQMKQYPYELQEANFLENSSQQLAFKIRDTKPSFPHPISNELKELINRMLEFDPIKRITLSEVLQHPLLRNLLSLTNMRPEGAIYIESQEVLEKFSKFYEDASMKSVYQRYDSLVSTVTLANTQLTDEQEQLLTQSQMQMVFSESKKRQTRDIMLKNIFAGYEFNFNVLLWLSKIFYNYQRSEQLFNSTQHQVMVLLFQLIILEFKSHVEQLKNDENTFLVDQEYWVELLKYEDYIRYKEQVISIYYPILQSNEQFILQDIKEDMTVEKETRQLLTSTKKEEISQALTKKTIQLIDQFNQYRRRSQKNPTVISIIANNVLFYLTLIDTKTFFAELKKQGPFDFFTLEEQFKPKMQQIEEFLDQATLRSQSILQKFKSNVQPKEQEQAEEQKQVHEQSQTEASDQSDND